MSDPLSSVLGVPDPTNPASPVGPPQKLAVKAFCRAILASPQYRESLMRRILMDTLPTNIEHMLWDRAEGKVVEKLEVKDTSAPLSTLSADALEERAKLLVTRAQQLRQQAAAPAVDDGASVH